MSPVQPVRPVCDRRAFECAFAIEIGDRRLVVQCS